VREKSPLPPFVKGENKKGGFERGGLKIL